MAAKAKLQPAQKSTQQLANEVAAAVALRETLKAMGADDADLIRDSIEGETSLHEAIAKVDEFILEDESLVAGIAQMQQTLAARKARIEKRLDFYRGAIEQAMLIGGIDEKMQLATGTLTLRKVAGKLDVTQESDIPAIYFIRPDPVLDKTAVLAALKAHREAVKAAEDEGTEPPPLPFKGAEITAEGVTLSIRRA